VRRIAQHAFVLHPLDGEHDKAGEDERAHRIGFVDSVQLSLPSLPALCKYSAI
jgi:hypothetical protein